MDGSPYIDDRGLVTSGITLPAFCCLYCEFAALLLSTFSGQWLEGRRASGAGWQAQAPLF